MLSLTDLLRVQDLGLESTILTPKCPSASVNPENQLSENKSDISKLLLGIIKLYLLLKNSINWLKDSFLGVLSLLWTVLMNNVIPFTSPIIYLIMLLFTFWKRPIPPNTDWIYTYNSKLLICDVKTILGLRTIRLKGEVLPKKAKEIWPSP